MLRLVVMYTYPTACNICVQIINISVYNEPQIDDVIYIRNALLTHVPHPFLVIKISKNSDILHEN